MPAMLDDPSAPPNYRRSGDLPFHDPDTSLPANIMPRETTLKDGTKATLMPFTSPTQVPPALLHHLTTEFNAELERGDTYPMLDAMSSPAFGAYWFGLFAAVLLAGDAPTVQALLTSNVDWEHLCLGSFYIKPNYPGRSSHICNGGFLVTSAARGRGAGKRMGEAYLAWAPQLGYRYSVFNLVYENNVASCRIWDSLGFAKIGRVPGGGSLKSYPGRYIDAIIYGKELVSE